MRVTFDADQPFGWLWKGTTRKGRRAVVKLRSGPQRWPLLVDLERDDDGQTRYEFTLLHAELTAR